MGQVSRPVDPLPGPGMAWSMLETSVPATLKQAGTVGSSMS